MRPSTDISVALSSDLRALARRAALRTIPCAALSWNIEKGVVDLRHHHIQYRYLEALAEAVDRVSRQLPRSVLEMSVSYQEAASCALLQIVNLKPAIRFRQLATATVNCATHHVEPSNFDRIIGTVAELNEVELQLLELYKSIPAGPRDDPKDGYDLGARSKPLGSEIVVQAAAQRLSEFELVKERMELPLDTVQRYLAPAALTELGNSVIALLSEPNVGP